jgi:DNA-binding MarR family transcriptional regulator
LELQALTLAESQKIFSVRELSAQLADDASALSRLVAKWVTGGFAREEAEQRDLRTNAYALTASGRRRFATALEGFAATTKPGVAGLGQAKAEELVQLLKKITAEFPVKPGAGKSTNVQLFLADLSPAERRQFNVEGGRAIGCYLRGRVVGVAFTESKSQSIMLTLLPGLSIDNRALVAAALAEALP